MLVSKGMTIGTLAHAAGCTVPTVRYYEEIALLPQADRREGGHRVYDEADLRRLTFIRRCRDFGFPIEHIRALVTLNPDQDCADARDLVQEHLDAVRRKLKELRALERSLKKFVQECDSQCASGAARACVMLEDLAGATQPACCGSPATPAKSARAQNDDCCAGQAKRGAGHVPAIRT